MLADWLKELFELFKEGVRARTLNEVEAKYIFRQLLEGRACTSCGDF